jgi:hypothetical protein
VKIHVHVAAVEALRKKERQGAKLRKKERQRRNSENHQNGWFSEFRPLVEC